MRISFVTAIAAFSTAVVASPVASPEPQRLGLLPDNGNFTLGLLPYQLATRLVKDGQVLLELGPDDLVRVLKGTKGGLNQRQAPVTGPVGNTLACAIGCAPV